jgi:hypothetical protein
MNNEQTTQKIEEKDWMHHDRLDTFGWGMTLIWAGLVLVAELTGFGSGFAWWDGWGVFFTGAGTIALLGTVARVLVPEYRYKWVASLVWGLILLSFGLGDSQGWGWLWVGVLIVIGLGIFGKALKRVR